MNTCLEKLEERGKQKDENEEQLQFHFPEMAAFNTFLKTMLREGKTLLHVAALKPSQAIFTQELKASKLHGSHLLPSHQSRRSPCGFGMLKDARNPPLGVRPQVRSQSLWLLCSSLPSTSSLFLLL